MRLMQNSKISWWEKSRLLSLFGLAAVIALMLLVSIALSNPPTDENLGRLNALMLSIVPLLVVFAIAIFARVSEHINLRSGGLTSQQETHSKRGGK